MVAFGAVDAKLTACVVLFWFCCYFIHAVLIRNQFKLRITASSANRMIKEKGISFLAVVFCLSILYISGRYIRFRFNFSLTNVYELRNEAKALPLPKILSYLYSLSKVCLPVIMAFYLCRKQWIRGSICFITLLLAFGIDGAKFVLFFTILVVIVSILPNFDMVKLNRLSLLGLTIVVFGSLLLYLLFGKLFAFSLFVRRLIFVPLRITQCYVDFFTTHTPDYFRGSFMRLFGAVTPYPDMEKMIGAVYFNAPEMHANCGLVANAVANLGISGCVIIPIIMMAVFYLLDLAGDGVDHRIYITVVIYASQALINSAFFTVLLTHGMLVIILILALMKKNDFPALPFYRTRSSTLSDEAAVG